MKNYFIFIIALFYLNLLHAQLSVNIYLYNYCTVGCSITGFAYVNGGAAPYTYIWSNGETGENADSLCPGLCFVTVTDSNGDTASTSNNSYNYPTLSASFSSHNSWCSYSTGSIDVNITSGTPPYTAVWSNSQTTLNPTGLAAGTYITTISDANGCTITDYVVVSIEDLPVDIGFDHVVCSNYTDTLSVPPINYPPITYLWNDGSVNSSLVINPTSTSIYSVTVTDNNGCSGTDTVLYDVTTNCNIISGYVFYDANHNGIKDSTENGLVNSIVQATPGQNYATTDTNGYFLLYTDIGNYSINLVSLPLDYIITTSPQTANFISSGEVDSLNYFGIVYNSDTSLSVNLTMGCASPGFIHNENFVLKNLSNTTLAVTVKLIFDSNLVLQSTYPPYNQVNGDTIIWTINDFFAYIYYYFPNYLYYDFLGSSSIGNFNASFLVPSTVLINDTLFSSVMVEPIAGDINPLDNESSGFSVVTGSFDPNNKEVFPDRDITTNEVDSGQWMTYTVNFQNTGNDTCFTLIIRDTISPLLDIGTMQILGSSHSFLTQINEREFKWTFPNILLPDSSKSQISSCGYLKYRMKVVNSAIAGDLIENTANIYFDYNLPVQTNTTQTLISTILDVQNNNSEMLSIYPNPTTGNVYIKSNIFNNKSIKIFVSDITGKIVYNSTLMMNEGFCNLNLKVEPGIYFLTVKNALFTSNQKIVVVR